MGAVDTTYTFTATDTITSTKMNNIIDQTVITSDAITGTTLEVASGKLKIRSAGITSNELSTNAITTTAITDLNVTTGKIADLAVTTGSLMTQICSTVISEGGFDNTGKRVVVTSNNGATIGASEYDAVLFIRYNSSTSKGAQIVPEQLDLLIKPGNSSTFAGRWELLVNPTVTNAVTYNNASGSIVTQVAVVAAGNVITNPGTIIATGYFAGTSANSVAQMIVLDPYYGLGRKIDGTSDVLAVGIKTIDNTYTVYPSLIVRELI